MSRVKDLVGQRFGRLVVVEYAGYIRQRACWKCQCDCGKTTIVPAYRLKSGNTKGCGCTRGNPVEMVGKKFGRLTVLKEHVHEVKRRGLYYLCRCECGTEKVIDGSSLRRKRTVSCGCYNREAIIKAAKENALHGMSHTRIYNIWKDMRRRCLNKKRRSYDGYGARGIRVCERWLHSFENFYEDMGDQSEGMQLDRIDNDGDYSPENCRWATRSEQCNNTRRNHWIVFNGERLTASQWARKLGIKAATLLCRLNQYKWPIKEALLTPIAINNNKKHIAKIKRPRGHFGLVG